MNYTTLTSSGETTKTVYNDAFYPVEYTDENGNQIEFTYDEHLRVITKKCGSDITTYSYDSRGNIISYITGNTKTNLYLTYNSKDEVVRKQEGNNYTYYTYDNKGNNIIYATLKDDYKATAPALYDSNLDCFDTTTYTYDNNGRILSEVYSRGGSISYTYDNVGNILTETIVDVDNNITTTAYTYDSFGNILTTSKETENSLYVYDEAGRVLFYNENGKCHRTIYDNNGRVIQDIDDQDYDSSKDGLPSENTYSDTNVGHRYVYNEITGNLDSETNRLGIKTTYTYYSTGEKKKESLDIYEYNYNIKGNLTKVYVDGVNTLSYNYDEDYTLTSEVYANGQSIRYEYDDNGNLVKQYHNDDTSPYVTYSYNTDNELTQKVNTDTGLKSVYDGDNVEVYNISDDTLVQSYTESKTEADEENGIEAQTDITETHFGATYSSVIKDKSVSYINGNNTLEYSYTENDNTVDLDTVKYNNSSVLSANYSYDNNGNITKKDYGNSSSVTNTYDNKNRITSTSYNGKTFNYTHDVNSQLTAASGDNYSAFYAYDDRGNITNKTVNGTSTVFDYSTDGWNDKLISVNGTTLTYDANGNVLTYGDKSFTWSSGRNLASITDDDGNTYSYTYDENGIRTSKTVNDVTTYYNTKDGVILSQTDDTNTMYFQYDTSGIPLGFILNGTQYLYLTNQMGDVVAITDSTGAVIANYTYDEWGNITDISGNTNIANTNPLRYRGYYYDNETGYYYLQSRYYDAGISRFINSDIYDMAGAASQISESSNLMSYCYNNPINSSDMYGDSSWVPMSKGWSYRICPENPDLRIQRHMHVKKNGDKFSQKDDGSPHDQGGSPPNSVKKELKDKTGWDWDAKAKSYKESQKSSLSIELDFSDVGVVVVWTLIFVILLGTGVGIIFLLGLAAGGGLVLA